MHRLNARPTARRLAALLWVVAGLLLAAAAWLGAPAAQAGPAPQVTAHNAEPAAATQPASGATPTVDRLAPPPTVESPTQADEGAYLYWLNCQPCHGDQGQGLTDEWRAQYPDEDQNCWEAGCHGARPYEQGFVLPTRVPAVIGPQTLARFATVADLHAFISRAMPYQAPGSLSPEAYWAITAFLARAHGLPDDALPLSADAPGAALPVDPAAATAAAEATVAAAPTTAPTGLGQPGLVRWLGVLAAGGAGLLISLRWLRRRTRSNP